MTGLNCRPAACKAAALPAELIALRYIPEKINVRFCLAKFRKNLEIFLFLQFADGVP